MKKKIMLLVVLFVLFATSLMAVDTAIYYYTKESDKIMISLEGNFKVLQSYPSGHGCWAGIATPPNILNVNESKVRRIFFETDLRMRIHSDTGWSIARTDLEKWAMDCLPKLGLNQKETKDFIKTMDERCKDRFYEIYYVPPESIFEYYKTKIFPPPEVHIQVFFAFRAVPERRLLKPVNLRRLLIARSLIEFRTTHAVEWGIVIQ